MYHGPLTIYATLSVAHAPGMPGMISPPPRISDPDVHHCTCMTQVPWCTTETLTNGFIWSRWRGKRSRHSRRMRNTQVYVSGKWPTALAAMPVEVGLADYRQPLVDSSHIPVCGIHSCGRNQSSSTLWSFTSPKASNWSIVRDTCLLNVTQPILWLSCYVVRDISGIQNVILNNYSEYRSIHCITHQFVI